MCYNQECVDGHLHRADRGWCVGYDGVEYNGVEYNGVEYNGVGYNVAPAVGGQNVLGAG